MAEPKGGVARRSGPSRRRTIGLVTANIHLGVGATLWAGVLDAAERNDVNLICLPGGEVRATELPANAIYDLVSPDLLDGLICWASTLGLPVADERATRLARRFGRIPLVSLNGAIGDDPPLVLDSYHGMCKAIGHLVEVHGRRRLAFIRGPIANPVTMERYRAYTDTLARYRIPLDRTLVSAPVDFRREAGASAMRVLLDARGLRAGRDDGADFDAVVACSDFLAADALRVLSERGIDVPDDIAVVGVNDSPEARLADPPLTSVSMPFAALGELAVETLLSRLDGVCAADRPAPTSALVLRRSCGCAGGLLTDEPADSGVDRQPELRGAGVARSLATDAGLLGDELLDTFASALEGPALEGPGRDVAFVRQVDRLVRSWTPKTCLQGRASAPKTCLQGRASAPKTCLQGRASAPSSHQTDAWDAALLALRRHTLPLLTGPARAHAERLIGQARLAVAEAGRHLSEYERWQAEKTSRRLRELGNALSSATDAGALTDVLDWRLPELGIPHWRLCLEPSAALALAGALPGERRHSVVVEPLYVRDELLGFGVFEVGPRDGGVYRALGDQISAALKEIGLFQEVLDARDAAEKANRVKTALLSSVSDELRTPVEGILSHVAQALELVSGIADLPPRLLDRLKEINVSAEHQLGVISDLLELSRVEIDSLDLSTALVDPGAVLEDAPPVRLPLIQADGARLREALATLRGIAARLAGPAGKVTVEADVRAPHLRIRIGCVGTRLPDEPFGADGLGMGLGLPIARRLITLHNGSLRFRAGRDGGTFHVALPLPSPGGQPAAGGPADPLLAVGGPPEPAGPRLGLPLGLPVRRVDAGNDIAAILEDTRPAAVAWDLTDTRPADWWAIRQLYDHPKLRRTPFLLYPPRDQRGLGGDLAEAIGSLRPAGFRGPVVIADADVDGQAHYRRLVDQVRPGHPVLLAADGSTVLALLGLLGQEVPSLLILSKALPDMDAFDVLDRLHGDSRLQEVPVLVLSGGTVTTDDLQRAEPHARIVLLGKGILSAPETVELLARLLTPGGPPSHRSSLPVKRALAYLHQHYHHQITRRQVARAAGMSEDYLSRMFHRELYLSPWDYLNRLRIERAKERLRESDDSIQLVARRVGFHDRSYFSRIFRKLTGVPPQAFRESADAARPPA